MRTGFQTPSGEGNGQSKEFYLQLCEIAFRRLGWMVFQLQLAKAVDTVPMTRDYLRGWRG